MPDESVAAITREAPHEAPRLVVLLDIDGTLAPIVERPEFARVPDATLDVLARLAARRGVHVALITGRAAADARRLVPLDALWRVGNHGCETVQPDGTTTVHPLAESAEAELRRAAAELTDELASVEGALIEDKRWGLSVHYRRVAPADQAHVHAVAVAAGRRHGLRVSDGKVVVEIRPPGDVSKATAALALVESLGVAPPGSALFFAGDDVSDEEAIVAIGAAYPGAMTVRVADDGAATAARRVVADPAELAGVLAELDRALAP